MSAIVLTSETLISTPAPGNIEYNGQFFGTDSNASRAQLQRIARSTAVTCAGQTSIDFTNIPAWVEKITVMFSGVSTSGTSNIQIQLGDSGGIETTGYLGDGFSTAGGGVANANYTSGFGIGTTNQAAASLSHGNFTITNLTGNIWTIFGAVAQSTSATMNFTAGSKELSETLDRIRITTVNGTDTFDTTPSAGSINIIYEG